MLKKQQGATLLEGLISIAIFSIGILGLGAMQVTMMKSSQESRYRTIASYYAEEIIGLAMADSADNRSKYAVTNGSCTTSGFSPCSDWLTRVKTDLPESSSNTEKSNITINATTGIMSVSIRWKRPNDSEVQQYSTSTNLRIIGG